MVYYPIAQDQLPVYKGQYPVNPVSDSLTGEVLSLPIWPEIKEEAIAQVVQGIKQILK